MTTGEWRPEKAPANYSGTASMQGSCEVRYVCNGVSYSKAEWEALQRHQQLVAKLDEILSRLPPPPKDKE